jgi:beta-phosphoglucomutase-like phosphatase (HAD superfamily)
VEAHWRAFAARHDLDAAALLADLHGRRMIDTMAVAVPHLSPAELAAEAAWLEAARRDILALLSELDALIREVRAVLEQADGQE